MAGWFWFSACLAYLFWVAVTGRTGNPIQHFVDFDIYRRTLLEWRAGGDLYCAGNCTLGFTYPPFAAVVLLPLVILPALAGKVIITVLTVGAVVATVVFVTRVLKVRAGSWPWLAGVVLISEPVREDVLQGQISVLISCAAIAGVLLGTVRGGGLIGLVAAIKITPVISAAAVVNREARRSGFVAALGATIVAAGLLGTLVSFRAVHTYFFTVIWQTSRVGRLDTASNNSIAGLAAHLEVPSQVAALISTVASLPVLLALLMAARRADWSVPCQRLQLALLFAICSYLLTPVTWTHHCLAAPLAALVIAGNGRRIVGALCLLPWLVQIMHLADSHRHHWPGYLLDVPRPVSLMVLATLLVLELLRRPAAPNGPGDGVAAVKIQAQGAST